jgi:hypothetical protein
MAPKYDPWAPSGTFGSPKKNSPAFQREWKTLNSSGVLVNNVSTQIMVKPASSTGVSGTVYLWGLGFVCTQSNAGAIRIHDDADNVTYGVAVASRQGPFFLALPTPLEVTENSGLKATVLSYQNAMYCTPMYTTSTKKYEG